MSILRRLTFCVMVFTLTTRAQAPDELLYRSAMGSQPDTVRLSELNKLIKSFPQSRLLGEAYGTRFSILLTLRQDSAAFFSAHSYLAAKDSQSLPGALQNVAMELGYRKKYPDTALVLLDSSISLFRKKHGKINPAQLSTRAMLLFLLRKFGEAESTQHEAISLLSATAAFDPRYANYYAQLGQIQLETKPGIEGLVQYVHSKFASPQPFVEYDDLDSLFRLRIKDAAGVNRVRDSLFESLGNEYLRGSRDKVHAKKFIATSFSGNRVLLQNALKLARDAYDEASRQTLRERCEAAGALGLVLYSSGNFAEAEKALIEALQTIPPSETELYFALGSALEKQGKKNEAFETYLQGMTIGRPALLMKPLQSLLRELYPHASFDSLVSAAQRKYVDFFPPKYEPPASRDGQSNPRVVLAELFTGSECRPCQAADIAYDKLLERYDRSELAIVEYHLHIPRPDPMTTADGELRSEFYGVNSTPTSIINGTEFETSGGLGLMARSKFAVYADQIDRALNGKAQASIKMSTRIRKNKISLAVNAAVTKPRTTLRLRVVLAEDEIRYTGANGISSHRFVVRKMLRGSNGTSFSKTGKAAVKDAFTVSSIEEGLEKYLSSYEMKLQRPGVVFKERKSEIDPNHLYIIAFVQDNETHNVLQSALVKVKR